jgi:hypothetical protein
MIRLSNSTTPSRYDFLEVFVFLLRRQVCVRAVDARHGGQADPGLARSLCIAVPRASAVSDWRPSAGTMAMELSNMSILFNRRIRGHRSEVMFRSIGVEAAARASPGRLHARRGQRLQHDQRDAPRSASPRHRAGRRSRQGAARHGGSNSTVYNLLTRHGWRKLMPRPFHPKRDIAAQNAFKKTIFPML